jgi:hypothetical protein
MRFVLWKCRIWARLGRHRESDNYGDISDQNKRSEMRMNSITWADILERKAELQVPVTDDPERSPFPFQKGPDQSHKRPDWQLTERLAIVPRWRRMTKQFLLLILSL